MKLSLLYDTLEANCKQFVDKHASTASSDFKSLLQSTLSTIPRNNETNQSSVAGLDDSWLGTRLEVELPLGKDFASQSIKKSIVPELINQRFMWVDDYFHYDDWRSKQQ